MGILGGRDIERINESAIANIDRYINKSNDFSLDDLLGTKLVCKGYLGTKFTIKRRSDRYYQDIITEITLESTIAEEGLYFNLVKIPVGNYTIIVDDGYKKITVEVGANNYGQTYPVNYSYYDLIATFNSDGVLTVPEGVTYLFVTGCGGGGGGGGGAGWDNGTGGGCGGGGGGGAEYVSKKKINIGNATSIPITIGTGGAGGDAVNSGSVGKNGSNGNATLIGSFLTLQGGNCGIGGSTVGGAGGSGKTGGGTGGSGATESRGAGNNGTAGSGGGMYGYGGTGGGYMGRAGGGGGGCIGKGGNGGYGGTSTGGANDSSYGDNGGIGAGGGGGAGPNQNHYGGKAGGRGGNGQVLIYTGVNI
ncbi:MAG: hypothetical protein VB047_00915 [Anaerotignum propionicum]|uniref:glycine-rich domain-containing protein n=1 Tax=Anaerotignum propionicum TaxID=28446 RepID=UPI002B209480|nr:hypothetical protein [Anaerotignum propionicum]MEA5056109.1 hypothetical protein [Anaerotignum propionicum]